MTGSVSGAVVLLAGLVAAVALRIGVGGVAGVRDPGAGLAFAGALAALCLLTVPPAGAGAAAPSRHETPWIGRLEGVSRRLGALSSGGLRAVWLRAVGVGVVGGLGLCVVPVVVHLRSPAAPLDPAAFAGWAVVVSVVAVAEEAFLRGALWTAVAGSWAGETGALLVTTGAFGLLHLPFYGADALPLDLAVGLLLGGLRQLTGGWTAPATAHTLADLAGWWLR